ncbi:hypothetical protein [Pseudomonas sp. MH10]|uniref:DUF6957 family protein n=1 Tax=Pseudomonas sp. MH10 TaxID=3048627 RepID=UPI002AC8F2BB|nr:hypothetical protein [Pseudomonas sp. MH10]MEB0042638.1 hypothetical protein [Pseudomonas sp. MH10]WPX63537.1 hypothetical protein RHM59_22070 [Pseudomonas sp. MH10]
MHNLEIQRRIGLSAVMRGIEIDVLEAIGITKERYAGRSFCIVSEWVWVDLDAPDLVNEGLAAQGKKPVMLLAFNVLFDSMGTFKPGEWLRTTPMVKFVDGMFFHTQNKIYVLTGQGRQKSMSLSTVVRTF